MLRSIPLLLTMACTHYEVIPMEECDSTFRDEWWLIDSDVTDDLNIDNLCINLHSHGELEIINYDGDWNHSYEANCVLSPEEDADFYHIKNQGNALVSPSGEENWWLDVNFKSGLIKRSSELTECHWMY